MSGQVTSFWEGLGEAEDEAEAEEGDAEDLPVSPPPVWPHALRRNAPAKPEAERMVARREMDTGNYFLTIFGFLHDHSRFS